ncbi:MAG: flagellar hook-basal body complex protein FliE [Anaerolineae bacterium]|nr:flagellar hook-basal body complex protein FliE [Anaerolineae bacterium]
MQIPKVQSTEVPLILLGKESKRTNATDTAAQVGKTFSQILNDLQSSQYESDNLLKKLAAGEDVDLHQLMIATEQTDIAFKVALAIRDRLVEAYKEVTRMTI